MADNVQWIKLKVGMFDGNSFKKIKRAKIGGVSYRDKLTSVWFELLDLAGKSNSNGCLIDNNEIPYHSFEEIAIMLDRDEKEIELCMKFFLNEKMVEIIEDMYCLTNFVKYQNQEGLERIREQKRLAQAKWRDRKKQGLIEDVDKKTSTQTSTDNLPSYSNSYSLSSNNILKEENNIKEERHKYGEYGWIRLTNSQYEKLCKEHSKDYIDFVISKIDEYVQSNGNKNKYKDWNLVVRKAIREKWSCLKGIETKVNNQGSIRNTPIIQEGETSFKI